MDCPPVIFLIFNRPEHTRRVFEKIREVQPRHLFVVADGPRPGHAADEDRCAAVRAVIDDVDWPCDVHREFAETNLGCGRRVSSGITAAFEQFESAIILEDDCVPDSSFFEYCSTLLERYRDNPRVMCISGDNFQDGVIRGDGDYYFSKYAHCWGWATWKRAWQSYDINIPDWPRWRDSDVFEEICPQAEERRYWSSIFDRCYRDDIDTWDYQWILCCWMHQGLTALPNTNLVENIGIGPEATHTKVTEAPSRSTGKLTSLSPPSEITVDTEADLYTYRRHIRCYQEESVSRSARLIRGLRTSLSPVIRTLDKLPLTRELLFALRLCLKPDFRYRRRETRRLKHFPRYQTTETCLPGVSTLIADSASFLFAYDAIIEQQIYEFDSRSDSPMIIDGGANIGLALFYFKTRFPKSRIIAFEPDPNLFQILTRNVETWGFTDVQLNNCALWTKNDVLKFECEGGHSGSLVEGNRDSQHLETQIEVPTRALSDYLREPVDFLKLDIEGAETQVLRSCEPLLGNVRKLFVEYHSYPNVPQTIAELLTILDRAGFRVSIHAEVAPSKPFTAAPRSTGMDLGLDIFAWRERGFIHNNR
jgi:FkbM family methyltransferase